MQILSIRPETGGGNTIARFDAQLTPEIRMFGMKLVRTPRGYRVYAPNTNTSSVATFAPTLADNIARAALAALTGETDGTYSDHAA